jgi:hypothetical protein
MKQWIVFACVLILLASCVSIPNPEGELCCLVVGNLVLDFPDGFFTEGPRKIGWKVLVNFTDLENNTSFHSYTSNDGYFFFGGKLGHKYRLDSWQVSIREGTSLYRLGPDKVGLVFDLIPGKVLYLWHMLITFNSPNKLGGSYMWDFKPSISVMSKPNTIHEYIYAVQMNSVWLDYEVMTQTNLLDDTQQASKMMIEDMPNGTLVIIHDSY